MRSHLKSHHPIQYLTLNSKVTAPTLISQDEHVKKRKHSTQPTITTTFANMTKYSKDSQKSKAITQKITLLLVKQMLPISLVDSDEFKALIKELDNRYACPGRKYFSKTAIPTKAALVKEVNMRDLANATSVSCTTDGWSSVNTEPYVSLTVHFMTATWKLRTYCLRTIYMPESHTGKNIAGMLKTILQEYNLEVSDVSAFTTDNGSNMKVAIRELDMLMPRIPCFGHVLHNAINFATKGIAMVQDMLKECRSLISTLNHSHK